MANAKICDRCGKFFKPNTKYVDRFSVQKISDGGSSLHHKAYGDICPECAEKAVKWWNKKRKKAGDGQTEGC